MIEKRYQWLIILILALAVLGVVYYGVLGFMRRDTGEVVIDVLPTYATITIDGKQSGPGSRFLNEGSHTITVAAKDFTSSSHTIEVKKNSKQTLLASLIPANSTGEKWVQEHGDLYTEFEAKGAINAQEQGAKAQERFPVIDLLPYEDDGYTIGYRSPKEGELLITVRATSSLNRQLALSRIKSWGYDPAEFTIEFVNYRDPFITHGDTEEAQHDH